MKIMRALIVCLACLWAFPASAQSTPCDNPGAVPTSASKIAGTPITLSLCASPVGSDGAAIVSVQGFTIYDNGIATAATWVKGATSSVSGLTVWTLGWIVPPTTVVHTLQVTETGADSTGVMKESPKSTPFALTVTKIPTAPLAPTGFFGF